MAWGVTRAVNNGYIGVSNVARAFFPLFFIEFYVDPYSSIGTLYDSYSGWEGNQWKLYIDSAMDDYSTTDIMAASVDIHGEELSGKKFEIYYTFTVTDSNNKDSEKGRIVIQYYTDDYEERLDETILKTGTKGYVQMSMPEGTKIICIFTFSSYAGRHKETLMISSVKIDGYELVA